MKNIVLSCDENYILPTRVMLRSMAASNQDIKIWFVYADLAEEVIAPLKKDVESYGWAFEARELNEEYDKLFASFPVTFAFAKAMYYRLLLPWILPECDRALYLDADVLIRGSLDALYDTDLGENLIAAVLDAGGKARARKEKELNLKGQYHCSGMQLLDLKRIRAWKELDEFLRMIVEIKERVNLEYPDQDLMNVLYNGRILTVDERYNFVASWNLVKNFFRPGFRKNVVVAHFAATPKPWQEHYTGYYKKEYEHYLRQFQK